MATADYVAKANEPTFYTRVMFIALRAAQNVAAEAPETANHSNRVAYANRILRGEENAPLLAAHVISANAVIMGNIDADQDPADGDLEFVLSTVWDARANAFAAA